MSAADPDAPDAGRRANARRRIVQLIVAVPACFLVVLALHGLTADYREARRSQAALALRTAQAVGHIVEIHSRYSLRTRSTFPVGTVAFTAASGEDVRFPAWFNTGDKVGQAMTVYYDPADTQNHALSTEAFGFADVAWSNALLVVFALYATWLVFRIGRLPMASG